MSQTTEEIQAASEVQEVPEGTEVPVIENTQPVEVVDITDMPRTDIPAEPETAAEGRPEGYGTTPDGQECDCILCQIERAVETASKAQIVPIPLEVVVNILTEICTKENARWDKDPVTGEPLDRNFGEMIALIHREISEALEAHRSDTQDDHLPEFKGVDVELADAVIRICHLAGQRKIDLGAALVAKLRYNRTRADHTNEARTAPGGKKY